MVSTREVGSCANPLPEKAAIAPVRTANLVTFIMLRSSSAGKASLNHVIGPLHDLVVLDEEQACRHVKRPGRPVRRRHDDVVSLVEHQRSEHDGLENLEFRTALEEALDGVRDLLLADHR